MRGLSSLTCAIKLLLLLAASESSAQPIVAFAGSSVTLPCSYNAKYYGPLPACWGRGEVPLRGCNDRVINTNGRIVTFRKSARYLLERKFGQHDVSLTILSAVESDSGTYGCRVDIPGLFNDLKRNVILIIEKAPPTTTQAPVTSTTPTQPQTTTGPPTTTQAPVTSTAPTEPQTTTGPPTTTQAPVTSTAPTEPQTTTGPPTTPWAPMWSTWPTDPQTTRTLTSTAMDTHEPPATAPDPQARTLTSTAVNTHEPPTTHPGTSSRPTDPQTTRALTTTATDTHASHGVSHAALSPTTSLRRSTKENTEMQTIANIERKELKHPDVLNPSLWILVLGLTLILGAAGLILWCKQRKTGSLSIPSLIVHSAEDCKTLDTGCSHETSHIVMQDMEDNGKESDPMLLP